MTTQSSTRTGEYLDAGGVRTYHEVYGTGDPLVLMHGGLSTLEMLDPLSDLAALTAPTLVLLGDDDVVTVEYAVAMARTIPDAQLAVVPNTSHALPLEKPDLILLLIRDFLAAEQPPRMMSLRDLLGT